MEEERQGAMSECDRIHRQIMKTKQEVDELYNELINRQQNTALKS